MNILSEKTKKSYDYLSRYSGIPFYFQTLDEKYFYGLTSQLDLSIPYVSVPVEESSTLDNLALKYYGRPDLYWIIADFNRIQDPFISLFDNFKNIKIPTMTMLQYEVK